MYFPHDIFTEVDFKTLAIALLASSASFIVIKESELVGFSCCLKYLKQIGSVEQINKKQTIRNNGIILISDANNIREIKMTAKYSGYTIAIPLRMLSI